MADKWFTTQIRIREPVHEYLATEAKASGISITQAAGAILAAACSEGWTVGPVIVTRHPPDVARVADDSPTAGPAPA